MTAGFIERLQSASARAERDAGPPNSHVLAALAVAVVVTVALSDDREPGIATWYTLGGIAFVLTGLVTILDRDGWLIRQALAWIALMQRQRWPESDTLADPHAAAAWLEDDANREAPPLRRASVLISLGRSEEAAIVLDAFSPTTAQESASLIRLRSIVEGHSTGHVNHVPLRAAVEGLPAEEARYQLASSAWFQAWMDITAGRPWRKEFAGIVREIGPFPLPTRIRLWIAAEQSLAPIACILGVILATVLALFT